MKTIFNFAILIIGLSLISCEKSDDNKINIDPDNPLLGTWINQEYHEPYYVITRSTEFSNDKDGFKFEKTGTFISRDNAGFCGTPPITYTNYEGTWEPTTDDVVSITVSYWGGVNNYQLEIISVTDETLTYKYIFAEN